MKMTARGSIAALVTCVASAVGVSPALAVGAVPVDVPLEALEVPLGMETPHLATGVPLLTPGVPDGPRHHTGELLPNPILPMVPLAGELGTTDATSPLPSLLGTGRDGVAEVASPASDVAARTPGAVLGAPLAEPGAEHFGLPELALPKLGILAPTLQGDPAAALGVR
jgi:hypothetical protein